MIPFFILFIKLISSFEDVIYFWGEVYPVDEVDVEDADPTLAGRIPVFLTTTKFLLINYYLNCLARKAAGIPVVKEMTIGVGFISIKYF